MKIACVSVAINRISFVPSASTKTQEMRLFPSDNDRLN